MINAILRGKPDAGNPHARFDEGEVASEKLRRGSLLYRAFAIFAFLPFVTLGAGEVRLGGAIGAKADRFLQERVFSDYARTVMFAEAERAFDTCFDDDPGHPDEGYWQGEYWGKLMLGLVEGARYGHDEDLKRWCLERARELIRKHQREDGYLCTYRDETVLTYPQRWNWNIWGRKYTLWALIEVYEATCEKDILDAAAKLADHLIESLHRQGLEIWETGCYVGLASMSILKPILLLDRYRPTPRYREFADEIVRGWERAGNPAPNLIANAFSDRPLADWYGVPEEWAKAYELMSCLEGLVEYARVMDEKRILTAVERIWEKLAKYEANPVGSVAYFDHFYNARSIPNGLSEPCDITHWIRLSRELFLMTDDGKYLDAIEVAFYNGFLAAVWRDGKWGAHAVRSHGCRHRAAPRQVGMRNTQCCVANIPRTFFDFAATAVTRLADGTVSVNLLGESEATFPDGVKVRVVGGYPVREHVAVLVQSPKPVKVRVRVPDWCPWVDVRGYRGKVLMLWTKVHGGWFDFPAADSHDLVLDYRMPATIVQFPGVPVVPGVGTWAERFWSVDNPEVAPYFRTTAASRILKGPLILAKSKNAGTDPAGILSADTIDGRGFGATLEPLEPKGTWGRWRLTLTGRDGEKVTTDVCDFQSAADFDDPDNLFSIWF